MRSRWNVGYGSIHLELEVGLLLCGINVTSSPLQTNSVIRGWCWCGWMMTICNGDGQQSSTSYSAVTLAVEERHEEPAKDMHIPVMGGEQGLYFDGIDFDRGRPR